MFDIGFTEILLIGVVALIVVGPEKLPSVIRTGLSYVRQFKSGFAHIKSEVERELDLNDLKKDLNDSKNEASQLIGYDDLHESLDELRKESENLRDLAEDGYEYADNHIYDADIEKDTKQHQSVNLPEGDAEAETGVEGDIDTDQIAENTTSRITNPPS